MSLWNLSAGTASVVGAKKIKSSALPTTAYIMLGGKCKNNCGFCSQARDSQAKDNLLSRVNWPPFEGADIVPGIKDAWAKGDFKRVCLQVVNGERSWSETINALIELKESKPMPLCVSSYFESVQQAEELIEAGAERICIALDAATPEIYNRTKEGAWEKRWRLLVECAAALPGRVTTHLIVGLGETEEEMAKVITYCIGLGVTVGLFAFTPVRGTALSDRQPPSIDHYRRIQIAHYLLKKGYGLDAIHCRGGRIINFNVPNVHDILADGKAFETSGCPDCNRPYYNESPRSIMFNYHRPLAAGEIRQAILESGIVKKAEL
jgi:biotin synthase